ncbi:MAG: phosphoribosylanthranilate isomerase [SAR324 cluster bacterium]|nr:phosphoribosylanthranilate isomerase [SAR324 cluster bacterium]
MSLRVKICGLTRLEDALHAEACGAHALGFIFWEHSPRAVTPAAAAAIIAALHPFTVKVGVFVNEETGRINEIAERCRLDRIQLHGGEPYETLAALNRPAYRAFRLKDEAALFAAEQAPDRWMMVDTHDPALVGGTGRPANWNWAARLAKSRSIVLAGGLSAGNVQAAIDAVNPAAIDAASSLEAAPGHKDPARVEAFFTALQQANLSPRSGNQTDAASQALTTAF